MEPQGRILVLEDSELQAKRLLDLLEDDGYAVTAAGDGAEGLDMLKKSAPDLIMCDVWMPVMDGLEFCRTVKQDKRLAHIPLMLITSLSEPKDVAQGLNAGADYYLTKPYSSSLLLSMVHSITHHQQSYSPKGVATVEVRLRDRLQKISASPHQIANFLFSTYENLVSHNKDLSHAKRELKSANDRLEERIKEKTLRLEQEIAGHKKTNETLTKTLMGTVGALARVVDMRDPYTAGHQMRVGELAYAIGRSLGFPEDRLEGVRVMGFLHDVGKIIVPAEILTKPSKLNDYESMFIKAHAQAGHDILKDIEFPWPVASAVLQHHERLNGSGYPSGLSGEQIIVEAKILAVADVVESMSSHRPYRPALGIDAAMEEIAAKQGILYDPAVAAALMEVIGYSQLGSAERTEACRFVI
jgi:putative nucleotidyltransferase with HDIG domain